MKPKLSIIIVNYRSADVLEHCLRSIHGATDQAVEIILVDNSPGQGAEVVLKQSGLSGVYFPQAENIGYTRAINFGAAHATGDFLCFLNPDILLGPHSLDRLLEWAQQHPRTVTGPRHLNGQGKPQISAYPYLRLRSSWGANNIFKFFWPRAIHLFLPWRLPAVRYIRLCRRAQNPARVEVLNGRCLVMAKTIWLEVGNYSDELIAFGLESEWFERARDFGVTAWYIPSATLYHE